MKIGFSLLIVFAFAFGQANAQEQSGKESMVKVGEVAPDWELPGTDGKTYKLSNFKGKQAVVVAWYPAALTGG